jgi:hypothetical protein
MRFMQLEDKWSLALVAVIVVTFFILGFATSTSQGEALAAGGNAIAGYAFADTNGDAARSPGEAGVSDVIVAALPVGGTAVVSATTDSLGFYEIDGLVAGDYEVHVYPPDGYTTTTSVVTTPVTDTVVTEVHWPLQMTGPTPTPTQPPTETPTATEGPTNTPTATDEPTTTPSPTNTPEPTDQPTNTPPPTDTPEPTAQPTETPLPTSTPTPSPEPTETPSAPMSLSVTPSEGAPGETFHVVGSGYEVSEQVSVWLIKPDGSTVELSGGQASSGGGVNLSFVAPPDYAGGVYTVRVRGRSSGREAGASFYLTDSPAPTSTPAASPTPYATTGAGTSSTPVYDETTAPTATPEAVDPLLVGLSVEMGEEDPSPDTGSGLARWRVGFTTSLTVVMVMLAMILTDERQPVLRPTRSYR